MSDLRERIDSYLSRHETSPLEFKEIFSEREIKSDISDTQSLETLIERCLQLMEIACSYNTETGALETIDGKWRSSLDIWRHIKLFRPQVTIYQVMKTLWIIKSKLVGHYCPDIRRRVFKLKETNLTCGLVYGTMYKRQLDEYDVDFPDWDTLE